MKSISYETARPISVCLIEGLSPPCRHGDENGTLAALTPKPPLHCAKETVKRSRVLALDFTRLQPQTTWNEPMNPCIKLAREFKCADRALTSLTPAERLANEAKLEATYDRTVFLLTVAKPESLPDAGGLIHIATRLACGAIPDDMQQSLFFIAAALKKSKLCLEDVKALRDAIMVITFLPVDGEQAPVEIRLPECGAIGANNKDDILSMLNNALSFMCRPRLV
jgi:hypothetical protein